MEMSLLPPARPAELVSRTRGFLRWALSRIRAYSGVQAPPVERREQALYGFSQPLLGMRLLLADRELLQESLYPAAVLALVCALYASVQGGSGQWSWFGEFYKAFAATAPLPSLVFANHYARLGALMRWRMGLGVCGPREFPVSMLIGRLVRQTLIVALGVGPFLLVARLVPLLHLFLTPLVFALWGIHWVVADAFDDAQVLQPGETLRESIEHDRNARPPWFVRMFLRAADALPFVGRPLRWFARLCDNLALDSRGEIATMERHPAISLGFALSTAALLATPVLNLLFRPIILAGSSHLLGQLEKLEPPPSDHQLNGAGTPT